MDVRLAHFQIDRIGLLRFVPYEWCEYKELYRICRKELNGREIFSMQTMGTIAERLVKAGLILRRYSTIQKSGRGLRIYQKVEFKITEAGIAKKRELWPEMVNIASTSI